MTAARRDTASNAHLFRMNDYMCWTVFAGSQLERPCYARILDIPRYDGNFVFALVRVVSAGDAPSPVHVGFEFRANLNGWPPDGAICNCYTEETMPDEAWVQIATEQLLSVTCSSY